MAISFSHVRRQGNFVARSIVRCAKHVFICHKFICVDGRCFFTPQCCNLCQLDCQFLIKFAALFLKKKKKRLSLPNLILEGDAFNVFNSLQSVFVLPNWLVAPVLGDFVIGFNISFSCWNIVIVKTKKRYK